MRSWIRSDTRGWHGCKEIACRPSSTFFKHTKARFHEIDVRMRRRTIRTPIPLDVRAFDVRYLVQVAWMYYCDEDGASGGGSGGITERASGGDGIAPGAR